MNAYQIRNSLLQQAREMLFESWNRKQDIEMYHAEAGARPPQFIPAPTVAEVLAAATALKTFVDGAEGQPV